MERRAKGTILIIMKNCNLHQCCIGPVNPIPRTRSMPACPKNGLETYKNDAYTYPPCWVFKAL